MAWTFAHPAAVLPLRRLCRSRLSFCALVVGSMSPDFGFYFGSFAVSRMAHTLGGLFTICLPSGLALLALIRVLHRPIGALLPFPHRQRVLSLARVPSLRSPSAFFWASFSLLVGGLTHLVWDSFTHQSGYFVLQWPMLRNTTLFFGKKAFELYEVLQDLSSVLGAAIVIFAYRQWVRGGDISRNYQMQADDRWRYQLLAIIATSALLVAAPIAYSVSTAAHRGTNLVLFAVRLLIYSTTAFFVLLCVASIAVARRRGRFSACPGAGWEVGNAPESQDRDPNL
jgi:Domain of unknown function (DUF4184)